MTGPITLSKAPTKISFSVSQDYKQPWKNAAVSLREEPGRLPSSQVLQRVQEILGNHSGGRQVHQQDESRRCREENESKGLGKTRIISCPGKDALVPEICPKPKETWQHTFPFLKVGWTNLCSFHAPKDAAFSGGSLIPETSRVSQVHSTKHAWHFLLEWRGYLILQAGQTQAARIS